MAENARGTGRGCFKFGCLGCLGVAAVLALVGGGIVVLGLVLGPPEEDVQRADWTQETPGPATAGPGSDRGMDEFPEAPSSSFFGPPGRIVLDLSMGEFQIEAGDPADGIQVDGRFDGGSYELEPSYRTEADGSWVYTLSFGSKVSFLRTLLHENAGENRIRLTLPRGVPFRLEGSVGVGQSEFDLTGLSVLDLDLEFGAGSHSLEFDSPSPVEMGGFRVDGSIGEMSVEGLGNASPSTVWMAHSMGETRLDLSGAWTNDAEIELRCGVGECSIGAPDQAAVDLANASVWIGETDTSALRRLPQSGATDLPTLTLSVAARIGEVRFGR